MTGERVNSFEFAGNRYFIVAEARSMIVGPQSRSPFANRVEACSVERYAFQLRSHALLKVFKKFFKSKYERV